MPVTDREKRSTEPAKVMLTLAGVPEANLTAPTRVSGGGSSSLRLSAFADASVTCPSPVLMALQFRCSLLCKRQHAAESQRDDVLLLTLSAATATMQSCTRQVQTISS